MAFTCPGARASVLSSRFLTSKAPSACHPLSQLSPCHPTSHLSAFQLTRSTRPTVAGRIRASETASALSAMAPGGESPKTVLVPIADGTEEMEAVIVVDVLRRAGADVTVASVEPQLEVTASRKVKLVADKSMESCTESSYDLIVLPGGMPGAERLRDSLPLQSLVLKQAAEGKELAAICAAPVVALASWGLLKGRKATAHPAFSDKLEDTSAVSGRVVEDGSVTTSRGPGTAFEFALKLVERLHGAEKAAAVAGPMVMPSGDDRWRLEIGPRGDVKGSAKVLVPIADGTEEMEAVIVIDVLRRAGAEVVVASVEESLTVVASRKVKLVADVSISDAARDSYDLIVLPGGMPGAERLRDSAVLDAILKAHALESRGLAAICAAPVVALKAKGYLDGKAATAHPAFSKELEKQEAVPARVVRDGIVVTSRGPGTAFEFSLFLVELLFGAEKASAVASPMVMAEPMLAAA